MFFDSCFESVQLRHLTQYLVHIFQAVQFKVLILFKCVVINKCFDVSSKLSENTVGVSLKKDVLYL